MATHTASRCPHAGGGQAGVPAQFYGLEGLERLIIASTSLVVAQDGAAKYPTIASALRDAKPGDRILVQPGHYFESITIDKNVDLQGEGRAAPGFHVQEGGSSVARNRGTLVQTRCRTHRVVPRNVLHFSVSESLDSFLAAKINNCETQTPKVKYT